MAILQIEKEESPEEEGWKMYFDGASNALGRGVGAIIYHQKGTIVHSQQS